MGNSSQGRFKVDFEYGKCGEWFPCKLTKREDLQLL